MAGDRQAVEITPGPDWRAVKPPVRSTHSIAIHLDAPPEAIFPLMCPVREREWVPGWDPIAIWSESGLAEPECVFITEVGASPAVWVVTRHQPERRQLQLVRTVYGRTVTVVDIELQPGDDAGSMARIRYSMTALSEAGEEDTAAFTEASFGKMMDMWQEKISDRLGSHDS